MDDAGRPAELKRAFGSMLDNVLADCDFEAFQRCFEGLDASQMQETYTRLAQTLRSFAEAEFLAISTEAGLGPRLAALDAACAQREAATASDVDPMPALERAVASMQPPAEAARAYRVAALRAERARLEAAVLAAEADGNGVRAALHARREEASSLAQALVDGGGSLSEVQTHANTFANALSSRMVS